MRDLSEKYFPVIEKLLDSGLSMNAFSKQNGINIKTLHYWKKRYRDDNAKERPRGFTKLLVENAVNPADLTIQYPDGTRLNLTGTTDASFIKQFLPAFCK